jgi:leucyl-tRNA synthetase
MTSLAIEHGLAIRRVVADGDLTDSVFEGEVAFPGPSMIMHSQWMDGMTVTRPKPM